MNYFYFYCERLKIVIFLLYYILIYKIATDLNLETNDYKRYSVLINLSKIIIKCANFKLLISIIKLMEVHNKLPLKFILSLEFSDIDLSTGEIFEEKRDFVCIFKRVDDEIVYSSSEDFPEILKNYLIVNCLKIECKSYK